MIGSPEDSQAQFAALFQEQMQRLAVADRISEIEREVPQLVESIRNVEVGSALRFVAGLQTIPVLHPNTIRLEALSHLILARAHGTQHLTAEAVEDWFNNELGEATVGQLEDPVDDVFVSNVVTGRGNRRIFTGVWDNPDFWLQDLLDVLSTAPAIPAFDRLRNEVDALLLLSEALAVRSGVTRFSISDGQETAPISMAKLPDVGELSGRAAFTDADLEQLGIASDLLTPFHFDFSGRAELSRQSITSSDLQNRPLLASGDALVLAIPAAVSVALRTHILKAAASLRGGLKQFSAVLHKRQAHHLFNEAVGFTHIENDLSGTLPPSGIDPKRLSQVAVTFDSGKFAHVLLLHDDLEEVLEEGLTSNKQPPTAFLEKLAAYLRASADVLNSQAGFPGGMTLLVMGGVGRGFGLVAPKMPENWAFTIWSLADIAGMAWLEQDWLLRLWKLMNQSAQVEHRGIHLVSNTGDVNVYSCWRDNEYRIVPREFPITAQHGDIAFAPGHVATFRQAFRRRFDTHAVYRPDERAWVVVRKTVPKGFFKEIEALPIYASADYAANGLLRGVVETNSRAWWVDCEPQATEPWQRETQYGLWDAVLNWMARLGPELDQHIPNLPDGNILVRLDLSDPAFWQERAVSEPLTGLPVGMSTSGQPATIKIVLHESIFELFQRPQNDGEALLVRTITEGAIRLAGLNENLTDEIVRAVVTSPDAKWMHYFPHPETVRDELAPLDGPEGRTVQDPDRTFAAIGLGWQVVEPQQDALEITGQEDSNRFLNSAVDLLWNRIKTRLHALDRRSLVELCLRNHEGLILERNVWRRTSRALTAVYRDRQDVISASAKHEADVNRGTLTSRVLAEMANCTCPINGGRQPGRGDLDQLLADIAWIITVAYESDAVRSGLADPAVRVFPNGEFAASERFYKTVIGPYQDGYFAERFEENVRDYSKLYKIRGPHGLPVEQVFEAEFITAFQQEYGLPLQGLIRAKEALEQLAVDQRKTVVLIGVSELHKLLEAADFNAQHADAFFKNFCLVPRTPWDSTPAGFKQKDWYPWRFRRHLSLMARPLVLLGSGDDDLVVYAPGLVHDAFANIVLGSHSGDFDTEYFRSNEMKSWIGAVNDRRGHEFNEHVAEEFRKVGYEARASVQMSRFHVPAELGDLGDVDVLAWRDCIVYPVECKNLRFARTIGEIVDQLTRFRGESGDELAKHLRRCEWLRLHPDELTRVTGLEAASVQPLLVTNTIVPMQFATGLPISAERIIPIHLLAEALREQ